MPEDPGTCTCKSVSGWCWGCGHDRRDCWDSCQRGLHGWCHPERNEQERLRRREREGV